MQTEPIGFKGTKGEWSLTESKPNGLDLYDGHYAIDSADMVDGDWAIAAVFKDAGDDCKANAELIAASKDMAIALQRLLPILQSERTQSGISLDIRYSTEYEQATEALTKAGL